MLDKLSLTAPGIACLHYHMTVQCNPIRLHSAALHCPHRLSSSDIVLSQVKSSQVNGTSRVVIIGGHRSLLVLVTTPSLVSLYAGRQLPPRVWVLISQVSGLGLHPVNLDILWVGFVGLVVWRSGYGFRLGASFSLSLRREVIISRYHHRSSTESDRLQSWRFRATRLVRQPTI